MTTQVVLGRHASCDVTLADASVSGKHARLSWRGPQLIIEDLDSANGVYVGGERVPHAVIAPGDDVRLGTAPLPWADPRLAPFLRRGRPGDTMLAMPRFGRYVCPECKAPGILPPAFRTGQLTCAGCGTVLTFGGRSSRRWTLWASPLVLVVSLGIAVTIVVRSPERRAFWTGLFSGHPPTLAPSATPMSPLSGLLGPPTEEERVRATAMPGVVAALDSSSPVTRDLAVQVAAHDQGPFHIEQVAAIWMYVRANFDYVNDPNGAEYFAKASETIGNHFAGDCDDFATTLGAMLQAIGGRVRIDVMDTTAGGHAYTEVCIDDEAAPIALRLARYYQRHWDRRLGARPPRHDVHYRSDATCKTWLNLDWSANVVGGPYNAELWSVAIYPDGRTETLQPASPSAGATTHATAMPPP